MTTTPAPAPIYIPWEYTPTGKAETWVRGFLKHMPPRLDPTDLRATMGRQAPRIMREAMEEGR